MRILVDHSGYDLRNVGDSAMLQVCVSRLQQAVPHAQIGVVTTAPDRLRELCPAASPVRSRVVESRWLRPLPRSRKLALEQAWKCVGPYLVRAGNGSHPDSRNAKLAVAPSVLHAVRDADLVVAAGGGYVTDDWWWHAAGVFAVLHAAQRLGRPTAMFGQGLGPLTNAALKRQAAMVLPKLAVLGLREGVMGLPLARDFGVPKSNVVVTGDDALELATNLPAPKRLPDVLGLNVRLAAYTNLDRAVTAPLRAALRQIVAEYDPVLQGLPVSRHTGSDDAEGIAQLVEGFAAGRVRAGEPNTPAKLAAASGGCRAVMTASYHAAVFALAAGVPTVCLSRSRYYDAKFRGLADLFPGAATMVTLEGEHVQERLHIALRHAWEAPATVRENARASALRQVAAGRALYERFLAPWRSTPRDPHAMAIPA